KGTYIRALSEWLAEQIQTLAYTISLKRESIGKITLQDAVALEDLKTDNWTNSQISYERVFPDWTCLKLNDEELYKVINGMDIEFSESSSDIILLLNQDELCALGKKSNNVIHPFIVLK
ncbi:MAG: tRNA pseudouridine(55) synthase TruB, partial [Candidatus Cloacimonas sp.]